MYRKEGARLIRKARSSRPVVEQSPSSSHFQADHIQLASYVLYLDIRSPCYSLSEENIDPAFSLSNTQAWSCPIENCHVIIVMTPSFNKTYLLDIMKTSRVSYTQNTDGANIADLEMFPQYDASHPPNSTHSPISDSIKETGP